MSEFDKEYPQLKKEDAPIYNFHHDLIELYLNLCRKTDQSAIKKIYNCFRNAIQRVIDDETIDEPKRKEHLLLLYKLIAQTRDITYGKGEKCITYVLIAAWYTFYPVSACFALKTLVTNHDNDDDLFSPYGSWCDIKYFCGYVNDANYIDNDDKTKLIDTAIGLLNHQINKDRMSWNNTLKDFLEEKMNNPATFSQRPIGKDFMTFAVKWCPRENSKYGWLYELLVLQWSKMFSPNVKYETEAEFSVCKRNFRKMISALNKELQTPQVKQCANRWSDINPGDVSIGTLVKQKRAFSKADNTDRSECRDHFNEYYDDVNAVHNYKQNTNRTIIPLSKIVSYAMKYIEDGVENEKQKTWINSIWKKNMNHVTNSKLNNSIPIIDISWDLDKDSRNSAIGLGIAVAVKSDINRIILYDNVSYWITITPDEDFTSIIGKIYNKTQTATSSNIDSALSLVLEAFDSTASPETKNDMVFFIFNGGKDINLSIQKRFHSSTFIYWNIQRTGYLKYTHIHTSPGKFHLCGNSITDINNIQKYFIDRFKSGDLGNYIINLLNNPRYKVLEKCLIDIM